MYLELDYGTFEIFYADEETVAQWNEGYSVRSDVCDYAPGWYYWSCIPGCLPDGEPTGAFPTKAAAAYDCNEENTDWDKWLK